MSPWWLRPTADEEPKAKDSPRRPEEERPAKPEKPQSRGPDRPPKSAPRAPSRGRKKKKSTAAKGQKRAGVRRVVVLLDPEPLTRGLTSSEMASLDVQPVIGRLLETDEVVAKRAYASWEGQPHFRAISRQAGFDLIAIQESGPEVGAASIQLAVDAMELCLADDPVDAFVLISGESSLVPLVSKLKSHRRRVLGVGLRGTSSQALVEVCDEYLFLDDSEKESEPFAPAPEEPSQDVDAAMELMIEAIETLVDEDAGVLWGSVIKQTIQRKVPSFSESDFGFANFSELLEEGERRQLIKLKKDERSGTYIVTGFSPR